MTARATLKMTGTELTSGHSVRKVTHTSTGRGGMGGVLAEQRCGWGMGWGCLGWREGERVGGVREWWWYAVVVVRGGGGGGRWAG